jgi:hypothetical protein
MDPREANAEDERAHQSAFYARFGPTSAKLKRRTRNIYTRRWVTAEPRLSLDPTIPDFDGVADEWANLTEKMIWGSRYVRPAGERGLALQDSEWNVSDLCNSEVWRAPTKGVVLTEGVQTDTCGATGIWHWQAQIKAFEASMIVKTSGGRFDQSPVGHP